MARYYFDIINGSGLMRDDEGKDLPHSDAVREEVARIAFGFGQDEAPTQAAVAVTVNVRDDVGKKVYLANLNFTSNWTA